ncbi:Hypothetical_protein [Hexamita inflata]|uniref:Hypothetical_protein n=1 Tax=Hexamita inflata TaxID=28002 RepID=A0ABP1L221_9EUKA
MNDDDETTHLSKSQFWKYLLLPRIETPTLVQTLVQTLAQLSLIYYHHIMIDEKLKITKQVMIFAQSQKRICPILIVILYVIYDQTAVCDTQTSKFFFIFLCKSLILKRPSGVFGLCVFRYPNISQNFFLCQTGTT